MRFGTWNTQGDFTNGAKSTVIRQLYEGTDVLFLQEGGVSKLWGDGLFKTTQGLSVGAFNERCTNYVLVSNQFWNQNAKAISFTTVGGGIAGRLPAAVQVNDVLLVSWHSISAQDNSDTRQLLAECQKRLGQNDINTVVIGGDFNTHPSNIERMLITMAASSGGGQHYAVVGHTPDDMPTHNSGNVLDFFVILSKTGAPTPEVWVVPIEPSDHDPTFMDI